jgi:hypothetical protein
MSTPSLLIDALRGFVDGIVKEYWLETNRREKSKPPQVVMGYLPAKNSTPEPDYPFVIIRLAEGTDKKDGSTVVVKIIVGTYSEDSQNGWRDVANIIQRLRFELFKHGVVGKKFRVEYPMKFEIPEEQPYPEWIGIMTTTWAMAQPVEEVLYD